MKRPSVKYAVNDSILIALPPVARAAQCRSRVPRFSSKHEIVRSQRTREAYENNRIGSCMDDGAFYGRGANGEGWCD